MTTTISTTHQAGEAGLRSVASALMSSPTNWRHTTNRLDRIVSEAASAYLQGIRGRGARVDPLSWTRELDGLIRGRPVDYGRIGLPLMYAIRYMPRRVVSVIGALSEARPEHLLAHVTDIGCGTGAATVAIQLLYPTAEPALIGIDATRDD